MRENYKKYHVVHAQLINVAHLWGGLEENGSINRKLKAGIYVQ